MSLGHLLLCAWLILFGLSLAAIVTITSKFLGIFAIVTGIVLFAETYHPVTIYKRPQA